MGIKEICDEDGRFQKRGLNYGLIYINYCGLAKGNPRLECPYLGERIEGLNEKILAEKLILCTFVKP